VESFKRAPESQYGTQQGQMRNTDMLKQMAKERVDLARREVTRGMSKNDDRYNRAKKLAEDVKANVNSTLDKESKQGKSKERSLKDIFKIAVEQTKKEVANRTFITKDTRSSKEDLLQQIDANLQVSLGPDTGISDPRLVEDYRFLSGSAPFRSLDRMATSDTPITLVEATDSTAIYQSRAFYYEDVHKISVPLKDKDEAPRSREDVRADLIWEMENASSRRSFQRMKQLIPEPLNANSSPEERELYLYKRAKYTLAAEWNEWRNILECDHRVMAINADPKLGGEGPHVTRRYGVFFRNTDQNWAYFKNYVETQRANGHTLHFDPDAARPDWVGKHLLAVAQERYPDSLVITDKEVQSWKSETTKRIKSSSNNPFFSETIIERARKKI
jgi:hypothetical protein